MSCRTEEEVKHVLDTKNIVVTGDLLYEATPLVRRYLIPRVKESVIQDLLNRDKSKLNLVTRLRGENELEPSAPPGYWVA